MLTPAQELLVVELRRYLFVAIDRETRGYFRIYRNQT